MKKTGIYAITHRESGKKYVGQSINIDRRLYIHSLGNSEVIISRAIKRYGFDAFDVEILEECCREQLGQRERHWIQHLNSLSPNGYNLTSGGEQPVFSEETINKLRHCQQNRSPEHIANKTAAARRPETIAMISKAMKGRAVSEETRKKLSEAMKGRVFSQETIEAMRASATKNKQAFIDRMVAVHKGKKLTGEHKKKLSDSLRNPSAETRAKMSASQTGRKHSVDTLQKMITDRKSKEWSEMCAKGAKGKKQTPEQIAKRVAAALATKAAKRLLR